MTTVRDEDICEITATVWSAVSALEPTPCPDVRLPEARTGVLAGCVQVTGAFTGAVALFCSAALARRVAAEIFDVERACVTLAQTQDAVGELVNMTGGNLKALLPEPSLLSLPAVAQGTELAARVPGSRVVARVGFDCDGEPLVVTLHEKDAAGRRGSP
ncbi:MAG: chemotaxis protein CheX [bacterium]|nr:chemotaxis protein CheX [bacterium]